MGPAPAAPTSWRGQGGSAYLFDGSQSNVFTLAPPSTSITLTNLPYFGGEFKFTAGPDGQIYSVVYGGPHQLLALDPTTGQVTSGPLLSPPNLLGDGSHLFFDGTTLDVVSPNGLYTINTTTGALTEDFAFSSNIGGVYGVGRVAIRRARAGQSRPAGHRPGRRARVSPYASAAKRDRGGT